MKALGAEFKVAGSRSSEALCRFNLGWDIVDKLLSWLTDKTQVTKL
jgi:hypothetical protein